MELTRQAKASELAEPAYLRPIARQAPATMLQYA